MANSLRHDFHTDLATIISNDLHYQRSNYYYFLGKVEPWDIGDDVPLDIQADSNYENTLIRTNALYIKKISPNDISLVTLRYEWASGTTFTIWDNTKNVRGLNFYCVNSDNIVYKCLDNNGNAPSTVEPTGKSYFAFKTIDGYTWKYMYTIPSFKQNRFSSLKYMPVQKALSDSFYNKGSIDDVVVVNAGSGYSDAPLTYITVTGATTGSGAVGTIIAGGIGNITGFNITNGGTNYINGVDVTFNSPGGVGGTGTAIISGGVITGISIVTPGVGYITGESVVFSVGGGVVVPSVSRDTGEVTALTVIKPGAGYSAAPTLTISNTGGSGKYGHATALFSSVIYLGSIVEANILDPGIGYPADTDTTITVTGDGTGALFSPVIYNGTIVDVIVENPGSGYSSMGLTVIGSGNGAIVNPIIAASDFISDQSVVEQTTVPGAIYSIQVTTAGTDYSNSISVNVIGDGIGCTATATVVAGAITKITVTNFGSGYTYATVSFTDVSRVIVGSSIDAVAYIVLPPINGHGYDAVEELFGETMAINTSLRQDAAINILGQDYRQFGILKNPTTITTGKLFTDNYNLLTHTVSLNTATGLVLDEILLQNNTKFRVVYVNGTSVILQQIGTKYIVPSGTLIAATNNSRVYSVLSVAKYPIANKYSGKLLYVSNENPFSFTEDQGVVIKTFITF